MKTNELGTARRLHGKVVLITGASGGQGQAGARLFVREGACVVLCDVTDQPGRQLACELNKDGGEALYLNLDVTSEAQWRAAMRSVQRKFGRLHVLVNNAGVVSRAGIMETPLTAWRKVMDINLTGALLGMQHAAPLIRDSGGGAIINISSTAGITAHFGAAYTASKWGLRGLTKTAAMEFVDWGIRVNSVHPAQIVDTRMVAAAAPGYAAANQRLIPMGRPGYPDEVAQLVLFLASDESSYITGTEIVIDGGVTAGGLMRARGELQKTVAARQKRTHTAKSRRP